MKARKLKNEYERRRYWVLCRRERDNHDPARRGCRCGSYACRISGGGAGPSVGWPLIWNNGTTRARSAIARCHPPPPLDLAARYVDADDPPPHTCAGKCECDAIPF